MGGKNQARQVSSLRRTDDAIAECGCEQVPSLRSADRKHAEGRRAGEPQPVEGKDQMRQPLTPTQALVLEAFNRLSKRGYPPTIREVGAELGHASSSTTHGHLDVLVRKGYLGRTEKGGGGSRYYKQEGT